MIAKVRHAFTALPGGRGLLSPCNRLLQKCPPVVYFHCNESLHAAISNCQTILRESTSHPMWCRELVAGWPDFIGVVNASSHGVGGVILGELSGLPPTVFRLQWPTSIANELVSSDNITGSISNSDLEMAGLLLLWLCLFRYIQLQHISPFPMRRRNKEQIRPIPSVASSVPRADVVRRAPAATRNRNSILRLCGS